MLALFRVLALPGLIRCLENSSFTVEELKRINDILK